MLSGENYGLKINHMKSDQRQLRGHVLIIQDQTRRTGIGMHTNISGEDCSFKRVSVTQEWGLDVKVVTPLSFLSKISVPCVHVDPGGIFQVYIEMEGMESLASDLLDSSKAYKGWIGRPSSRLDVTPHSLGDINPLISYGCSCVTAVGDFMEFPTGESCPFFMKMLKALYEADFWSNNIMLEQYLTSEMTVAAWADILKRLIRTSFKSNKRCPDFMMKGLTWLMSRKGQTLATNCCLDKSQVVWFAGFSGSNLCPDFMIKGLTWNFSY
ncbi:hypothetical protein Tco_0824500 [Tanacetum coccineum]|uniref:Uncharacterized protein n=1 Tax=Tanacetum coccineum TaxID=301880 RepID=A0ABQ5APV2_9ASTR